MRVRMQVRVRVRVRPETRLRQAEGEEMQAGRRSHRPASQWQGPRSVRRLQSDGKRGKQVNLVTTEGWRADSTAAAAGRWELGRRCIAPVN